MSLTSGAKSLIRAAFMPAAAIIVAVALFFTATTLSAKADLDLAKSGGTPDQRTRANHIYGLNIAACVTTWIAYVMLIVGAIIGGKNAKM